MKTKTQWSKIKKSLESRLCDSLRPRLQIHLTRYGSREAASRLWILLDREPIFTTHDHKGLADEKWILKAGAVHPCLCWSSFYGTYGCEEAMGQYLNQGIEAALAAEHPLPRALAMFDARLGKRRLASPQVLEALATGSPLPRHFHALRCQAESLPRASQRHPRSVRKNEPWPGAE